MASSPTRLHLDVDHLRCESHKVTYRTKADALDAAEALMLADRVSPGCHITPYLCQDCGHWHVWNRVIVYLGPQQRAWV